MNKTLIAAAVSAALMAPVAAQAEATVYGRVHQGIAFVNNDEADSTTDFINVGSRFGIKGSSDLGNGLTASAHYEFTTDSDTKGVGVSNTRIATVGISGAFGSVNLGNQWSAWYNQLGVHVDPTFYVGGSHHIGPFRTPNTISYSNSFGPVSIQADTRIDSGGDGGDGNAVGASIAINDNIKIAAAIDDSDARSLTGLAAQVSMGNYWASIAQQSMDPEGDGADPSTVQLWVIPRPCLVRVVMTTMQAANLVMSPWAFITTWAEVSNCSSKVTAKIQTVHLMTTVVSLVIVPPIYLVCVWISDSSSKSVRSSRVVRKHSPVFLCLITLLPDQVGDRL